MGNSESESHISSGIREYIEEEFQRLRRDSHRNYLTVSEVLQARHPEDFPFEFSHLGVLYICDHDQDGVFSIEDFETFALWVQINLPAIQMYEFKAQLQSRTVAKMV